jgi:cytosine/uracil/thiamine/allantoin permease
MSNVPKSGLASRWKLFAILAFAIAMLVLHVAVGGLLTLIGPDYGLGVMTGCVVAGAAYWIHRRRTRSLG